jgi:hypothetical protein
MPLNKKGKKIMSSMLDTYKSKAEEVFYASLNKGTVSGVHAKRKRKKHA